MLRDVDVKSSYFLLSLIIIIIHIQISSFPYTSVFSDFSLLNQPFIHSLVLKTDQQIAIITTVDNQNPTIKMQFSTVSFAIFAILPAMVAAMPAETSPVPKPALPVFEELCPDAERQKCAESTDNLKRCLQINGASICVIDCGSQTTCRTQCKQQLKNEKANGFCTVGDNPCICNLNGAANSAPDDN
ncbi:Biotrophy-associated secreted protein 3 [Pyricularia oryzae]|nr:Biotrophy-associated secreted protein 3 [Pyricularia oryzae]KAI6330456.1 Biotrophy-associated secreted protein 3 [Pyricularia oryzae]KAI6358339.1 Biotrophy-associated secreted protein 3 [Pyricularia oryzae]KAI6389614.1 Biotrophy-associated secreted protein 3 [Pyricularia oryzae]KAI6442337.1 Biotrophy-associated secreted protein 3 [Pyricularia oryzae]